MPYSDKELVELGSRFSTQRLIEQANVSVAMARAHAAELQKKFPPARVDELEAIITEIKAKFGTQAEAKESFGTAMGQLYTGKGNLIGQAKEFEKLGVSVQTPLPDHLVAKAALELEHLPEIADGTELETTQS